MSNLKINVKSPMKLYYDNKVTISIAHNLIQHDHTKHMEIDMHFIKEKLDSRIIRTPCVTSSNQYVDVLTKQLVGSSFHQIPGKLRMQNILAPT